LRGCRSTQSGGRCRNRLQRSGHRIHAKLMELGCIGGRDEQPPAGAIQRHPDGAIDMRDRRAAVRQLQAAVAGNPVEINVSRFSRCVEQMTLRSGRHGSRSGILHYDGIRCAL